MEELGMIPKVRFFKNNLTKTKTNSYKMILSARQKSYSQFQNHLYRIKVILIVCWNTVKK